MEQRILLILLFISFVSGCESSRLNSVEKTAKDEQQCLVLQILPDECQKYGKNLRIALLEAEKNGIDAKMITAAERLGREKITGTPNESPYSRVFRSLKSEPFYVDPEPDNFYPYTVRCPKEPEDYADHRAVLEYFDKKGPLDRYQAIAYVVKNSRAIFIFVTTNAPCMREKPDPVEDKFPILTQTQLDKLKSGEYAKKQATTFSSFNSYSRVEVLVYGSFEAAKKKYEELSKQVK